MKILLILSLLLFTTQAWARCERVEICDDYGNKLERICLLWGEMPYTRINDIRVKFCDPLKEQVYRQQGYARLLLGKRAAAEESFRHAGKFAAENESR